MARHGAKAQEKVEKSMHEMKRGKLRSGSGAKVTSRDQAIAIGLSEARKEGGKVPSKKASAKKSSSKSARPRKASTKKSTAKGSTARRTAAKRAASRKTASKKGSAKKK